MMGFMRVFIPIFKGIFAFCDVFRPIVAVKCCVTAAFLEFFALLENFVKIVNPNKSNFERDVTLPSVELG